MAALCCRHARRPQVRRRRTFEEEVAVANEEVEGEAIAAAAEDAPAAVLSLDEEEGPDADEEV